MKRILKSVSSIRGKYKLLSRALITGASRAPQVDLGTFVRFKLEILGIVRVITETLNPLYFQGKVSVGLRAGDGNRTRVLSLGTVPNRMIHASIRLNDR